MLNMTMSIKIMGLLRSISKHDVRKLRVNKVNMLTPGQGRLYCDAAF